MDEKYNGPAVYRITIGEDSYIGSTSHYLTRIKKHQYDFSHGWQPVRMTNAYKKVGSAEYQILEKIPEYETRLALLAREDYYIGLYKPSLNAKRNMECDPIKTIARLMQEQWAEEDNASQSATESEKQYHIQRAVNWESSISHLINYYFRPIGGYEK